MSLRTYTRTVFNDILKKNIIVIIVSKIVNFYYNLWFSNSKSIKFGQNIPTKDLKNNTKLSFQSITGDEIDCK